ncbi:MULTISPECIES: DUF932 domain-containing protein [unclassified Pseudomonas]|uniref:DUF932 domain-containing protein n=1 Tax=unclassified Pseudomonas TaxID=196821 RepID=UPI0007EE5351|nr:MULTISPECIES: DUF932 domain-containing protein [unclassified Pseudomonas]MDU4251189.1 DUF932 domain-containing protein [Pseudomonas sp.]OBY60054.1 hypothetical protein A9513_025715 [Pseudomonas sp. AU12215]
MAHLIEQMAYVGTTPWHGLGNQLTQQQPIEVWQREAGMDWEILESPVHFKSDAIGHLGTIHSFPEQKVLYRSDSKAPLSVVSQRYHTVQPREVLEFYRDLTEVSGYELETAGVLKGGRKFWALARTGQGTALKGNDQVNGYLLLATSCDGTLATTATPTTVRVVCNNTLTIALDGTSRAIKVPHNTRFDPQLVKKQLGIAVSQWDEFMYRMRTLAERKVKSKEALSFITTVLGDSLPTSQQGKTVPNIRAMQKVESLYQGHGRGSQLDSARGTAWGLLNAVTEFVDHERRARSNEYRMDSAWFGQGAQIKQRALDAALRLVA